MRNGDAPCRIKDIRSWEFPSCQEDSNGERPLCTHRMKASVSANRSPLHRVDAERPASNRYPGGRAPGCAPPPAARHPPAATTSRHHVYVKTLVFRQTLRIPVSRRNTSLFGIPATAPTRRPRSRTPGFLRSWAKSCYTGFNTLMYVFATRCYPPPPQNSVTFSTFAHRSFTGCEACSAPLERTRMTS